MHYSLCNYPQKSFWGGVWGGAFFKKYLPAFQFHFNIESRLFFFAFFAEIHL